MYDPFAVTDANVGKRAAVVDIYQDAHASFAPRGSGLFLCE
jgi:hypothetical protein